MKSLNKTIKKNEVYYTFDEEHDDPDRNELHYQFPNEHVGTGSTKEESQAAYREVEKKNNELREWAKWLQIHGELAYLNGDYETEKESK